MNKNYYYCFLCLVFIPLLGMEEQEISLPKMNTREVLKNYGKDELYKGFLFSTAMTGVSAAAMYRLKKLASRYPVLKFSPHANKNFLGGAVALTYLIPQVINLKTYHRLSTTDDLAHFKVKDQPIGSSAYTNYYFRPNPLKVLFERLLTVDHNNNNFESLVQPMAKELSTSNLNELQKYFLKIKNSKYSEKIDKIISTINKAISNQ